MRMKTNNQVFLALVAVLYGMVCFVLLATGYTVNDCVLLIGFITGLYLGMSLILMMARMILVAASDTNGDDIVERSEKHILKIKVPGWVNDWLDRIGNAGMVVLDLLPVMRITVVLWTLCLAMLIGVHYLFQMGAEDILTVLMRMSGAIGGLYLCHIAFMAAISWIERSDMVEDYEYVTRPLGSK